MSASSLAAIDAPALYWKMEQVDGQWITRQFNYLSQSEVAALLGVSKRTVYDMVHDPDNPLPHYRIPGGRGLRFRPDEVEKWLERPRE